MTLFPVARAMAPPDPPSPTTYEKIGELVDKQQLIELAIASDCPLSSASTPGNAPGVSIKVTTGKLNFAANFINLIDFLYPSGLPIPKLFFTLESISFPLSFPITTNVSPSRLPIPPLIAKSSL